MGEGEKYGWEDDKWGEDGIEKGEIRVQKEDEVSVVVTVSKEGGGSRSGEDKLLQRRDMGRTDVGRFLSAKMT